MQTEEPKTGEPGIEAKIVTLGDKNITAARVFSSNQCYCNNGYWNIVYLSLSTGDPQTTIFDVKIDPYWGFMTANCQHYYLPDYFAFLHSMVHTCV